jgi:hypothetical protein
MLHGAIFLATCNAILLLRDVKLPNTSLHYTPLMFSQHINLQSIIQFTSMISRNVSHTILPWQCLLTIPNATVLLQVNYVKRSSFEFLTHLEFSKLDLQI